MTDLNKLIENIESLPKTACILAGLWNAKQVCTAADLKALIADWQRRGEALAEIGNVAMFRSREGITNLARKALEHSVGEGE